MASTRSDVNDNAVGRGEAGRSEISPLADGGRPVEGEVVEAKDNRSPTEIEADLDRTRTRLSATLDELTERLTPRDLARRGGQRAKAQFVDPRTGQVRRGPAAAVAGGVGALVAAAVALRKLRSHSS